MSFPAMVLTFTFMLMLCARTYGGVLHLVLAEHIKLYENVVDLEAQLSIVLDVSLQLLETRTNLNELTDSIKFSRRLSSVDSENMSILAELIQATNRALVMVGKVAETQPTLAILSRRAFFACVILQWIVLGQNPFDKKLEKELTPMASEFYSIHVHSMLSKGLLDYLHISKSGGTSFSAAAKRSECRMAPGIGQLEALGDGPRWINGTAFKEITGGTHMIWSWYSTAGRPPEGQSCSQRMTHLAALGYNYVSNEFTLHGGGSPSESGAGGAGGRGDGGGDKNEGSIAEQATHGTHVCPQAINVVTLRSPDERLASHLDFMMARVKKRVVAPDAMKPSAFINLFCSGDEKVWKQVAPTVIDNYIVRSFLGEVAFHSPVGFIGREHVEVARRLLLQFDLVLDLDAGEQAADLTMQQGLGWNVTLAEMHMRSAAHTFKKLNYSNEDCPNDELLRKLLPRQEPDRMLYSTGRAIALLDRVFLGVARAMELQPGDVAAAEIGMDDRKRGGRRSSRANRWAKSGDILKACGLLQAASARKDVQTSRNKDAAARTTRSLLAVGL